MLTSIFLIRTVVEPSLRDKFDRWYSADHTPSACRVSKCDH